jgi:hypothetical protein
MPLKLYRDISHSAAVGLCFTVPTACAYKPPVLGGFIEILASHVCTCSFNSRAAELGLTAAHLLRFLEGEDRSMIDQ